MIFVQFGYRKQRSREAKHHLSGSPMRTTCGHLKAEFTFCLISLDPEAENNTNKHLSH